MSYAKDCTVRYLLKTLYEHGIQSNDSFRYLSTDDFRLIDGIDESDIATLQALQKEKLQDDLFASFRLEHVEPERMANFFKRLQINSENILQTNLLELKEQMHITKGRIDAFFQFKHACIRHTYNDTLHPKYDEKQATLVQLLTDTFFSSLKYYMTDDVYEMAHEEVTSYIERIGLQRVSVEKYSSELLAVLDLAYIVMPYVKDELGEIVYDVISREETEIPFMTLKQKLASFHVFTINELEHVLDDLIENGFIEQTEQGLRRVYPTILQYVENKLDKFPVIYERIHGKTLEEIGEKRGVTRERIRQLERREAKRLPIEKLYEYRYVPYFIRYELTEEEFRYVFHLDGVQYSFLKLFYQKETWKEQDSKEALLSNESLTVDEQKALLSVINREYLIVGEDHIRKNKFSIASYCIKQFAQETIHLTDFQQRLIEFCKEHELHEQFDFTAERPLEALVVRVEHLLWKYGRRFRYYGVDKEQIVRTIQLINFKRYNDREISAKRILDDYRADMEEIDIRDEYELHNLLKRYEEYVPDDVTFLRMPLIGIGKFDREGQLLDLLMATSPIDKEAFAEQYSDKFGVALETVKANYVPLLKQYEDGNMLNVDIPAVSDEMVRRLKSLLTDEFHLKEDIYAAYAHMYGEEKLPDYIFQQVGYRSFTHFILKEPHRRADLYFEAKYFQQDTFTIEDPRLFYLGSFRNTLEELRRNMDIFEYERNKFVRIETLTREYGVGKRDIRTLIDAILFEVGDRYFTVSLIQPIIARSEFGTFDWSDTFFESILKGCEELRFQYIGSNVVFRRTEAKFYTYHFISDLLAHFKWITLTDLIDHLVATYDIRLPREKIIQCTEMTNLYYHSGTETLFYHLEEFDKMLVSW